MSASFSGSCLCRAIRYTVPGPPATVCVCHCSLCRRSVGSSAVAWATFRRDDLAVEGTPAWFQSSAHARRGFCATCGTSLFFVTERQPHEVDVTVASLEQADRVAPKYHAWTPNKLAWEAIGDRLPQYREDGASLPMEVGRRGE